MRLKALRAPVLVGLVLLAGVAGLLYLVSKLKTSVYAEDDSYLVYAVFDDVTGLVVRSNVTMVGIPVGVIQAIERRTTEEGVQARVAIRLSRDVVLYAGLEEKGVLRGAASVIRKQSSILGDFYLALSPGAFGEPLQEGEYIPVVVARSGIEVMLEQASQWGNLYPKMERILSNVERVSDSLAAALGEEEDQQDLRELVVNLRATAADVRRIAQKAHTISEEVGRLVEDGTVARVAANIEETSEDARSIADRVEKMISAGDVDELVANLSETAHQMAEFGMQIRELTEKGIEPRLAQLNRVFQNFERFSAALAKFADEEMPNATAIMANVKTFSDQLVQLVTQGQLQLEQAMASVQGTLGQAQESLRKLDETLENVRVITEGVREGKGTVGRLLTDDKLINTVEEVLDDTKGFVKSYSLMQTEIDASTAFFPGRGAFKNTLSVRFRPNPDKYYLFQVVDDPWGTTTERFIWTETSAPPPEGPTEWKRVEETTHALKVSLQFAQNWYFLTGRFGLMENTGGLGLDFRFFEDRFQFQFDLFDFALDSNPRLRSLVQFEVVRHFYLEGGADDLLNQEYRDWFLAVGVRFTDEDLKTLLFAAPSVNP